MSVFSHPEFDRHERVVFCHEVRSGLRAIIAIHHTRRGPALGGCRMWPYPDDDAALRDVLRLSRAMTYKSALADLPLGGGKAVVIADPRRDKTPALLHALGDHIDALSGSYIAAEDSGTTVADMRVLRERTPHVAGLVEGDEHEGDPSPSTAYGTFVGLKAAVRARLGRDDLKGVKVAIQGLGNVGMALARLLHGAGAELHVSDIVPDNVQRAVAELGATAVAPDGIYGLDVDVFSPCALGGVLDDRSVAVLKARVVAGAANNQLAASEHGDRLRQRGILYVPDYVLNAGGIIDIAYQRSGEGRDAMRRHIDGIGTTLLEIFERAEREHRSTHAVADELAEERLR